MTPRFWSLTREQRRIHLDRSLKARDRVRPSRDASIWLVSSDTLSRKHGRPVFYRVNIQTATCGCEGWRNNGVCRHTARAIYEAWLCRNPKPENVIDFPKAA